MIKSSIMIRIRKKNPTKLKRKVLMKIPNTIENNTNPFRYSFFKGLKNVCKRRPTENNFARYELSFTKKSITPNPTS